MTRWQLFHEYMLILSAIWPLIEALIPATRDPNKTYKRGPGAGAKRTPNRILVNTILYSLMTATQWNGMPLFQIQKDTEVSGKQPTNGSCYGGG